MNDFLDACPFFVPATRTCAGLSRVRSAYPVRNASVDCEVNSARESLEAKGWTYRAAAPELGVSMTHLSWVLTGRRQSRRLLEAIAALPDRETSGR